MNRYDRDKAELGLRVALDLSTENLTDRNLRAQTVASRAESARHRAEWDRISATDYGLGD